MTQLHLSLRPGERRRAHERVGLVVLIEQVEYLRARRCDRGPEGNA